MRIRRPLAALLTALALFGGGATLTACNAAGQNQHDGTTDDDSTDHSGNTPIYEDGQGGQGRGAPDNPVD